MSTVVPLSFMGVDSFDKTRSSFRWTPSNFQHITLAGIHLELNKGEQDRELTVAGTLNKATISSGISC